VVGYLVGVGLGLGIAAALIAGDRPGGRIVVLVASQAGLWSALMLTCLLISRRRGTGSFAADYGWRFRPIDVGLGLAGSIVGRIVAAMTVALIPLPSRNVEAPDRPVVEQFTDGQWDWVVIVAIVCIGAPIIEELFFRGVLQSRIVTVVGAPAGIVITSLLFGAAHLIAWEGTITLVYGLAITGGGLVLGLMFHLTGRLGPSVMAHAFFNVQAVLASALLD
jgi:membrane protease YdiL (CAAX protease family)